MKGYTCKDMAAGYHHSAAIREDGSLWVWSTIADPDDKDRHHRFSRSLPGASYLQAPIVIRGEDLFIGRG